MVHLLPAAWQERGAQGEGPACSWRAACGGRRRHTVWRPVARPPALSAAHRSRTSVALASARPGARGSVLVAPPNSRLFPAGACCPRQTSDRLPASCTRRLMRRVQGGCAGPERVYGAGTAGGRAGRSPRARFRVNAPLLACLEQLAARGIAQTARADLACCRSRPAAGRHAARSAEQHSAEKQPFRAHRTQPPSSPRTFASLLR
jgi:hypothetical protein